MQEILPTLNLVSVVNILVSRTVVHCHSLNPNSTTSICCGFVAQQIDISNDII